MIYTSKQNAIIKDIAKLKEKKYRNMSGCYLAEGIKMVNEAISSGQDVVTVVVTESVIDQINLKNTNVITVSNEVFNYLSDEMSPQGALAVIKIPNQKLQAPLSRCLILDGVSDPGNLGSIIRTANAFSYSDIYLVNCVDAYSNKVVRASMSGIYFTRLYKCSLSELIPLLEGYEILAGDMHGIDIATVNPKGKIALAVGNEGNGLSEELKKYVTTTVKIPMSETCESLNVAVACSILMYKFK